MFSADELQGMRDTQETHMMDTCVLLTRTTDTLDEYNRPAVSYAESNPVPCGFDPTAAKEVMDNAQVAVTDARLRLPLSADVTGLDRVRVTHRFGEALDTPVVFDVIGEPERGPSGLVLNLRL